MSDNPDKISPKRFLAETLANLDDSTTGIVIILHSSEQSVVLQNGCSEDDMIFSVKMIIDGLYEEPTET